jgi:hypothetical protein
VPLAEEHLVEEIRRRGRDARQAGIEAAQHGEPLSLINVPGSVGRHSQMVRVERGLERFEERLYPWGMYVIPRSWELSNEVLKAKDITQAPVEWSETEFCQHCGAARGQPHDLAVLHPGLEVVVEDPSPAA